MKQINQELPDKSQISGKKKRKLKLKTKNFSETTQAD